MRAPFELGCRPSPASMTPAFTISSLNLPIAVSNSVLGMTPASLLLVGLHNHHESHRHAPFDFNSKGRRLTGARQQDEPGFAAPTRPAELFQR